MKDLIGVMNMSKNLLKRITKILKNRTKTIKKVQIVNPIFKQLIKEKIASI